MALAPHTLDDLRAVSARVRPGAGAGAGLITPPLPGADAGAGGCCDGLPPGQRGHCHVCGAHTGLAEARAAHAVAGFEETPTPAGPPYRLLVTHCREHADRRHDACRRDACTPGSGIEDGPGGYCEPLDRVLALDGVIVPGGRLLARFLRVALGTAALWLAGTLATSRSQGQQTADFQGPVSSLLYPGDAVPGHGFNSGLLRVLSGTAPAGANAAETGTLLIAWTLPNPAFGAPSAAQPPVCTAGAIPYVAASNSGTAGYGRLVEQADTFGASTSFRRYQFGVGTSGADMNFNTLSISAGGNCACTSLTVTQGS
ncbi:MAG TPA: hypothetical protein VFA70_06310 [Dehalococcoidia bacterium]|nr:hypothetical protein [Dehalococcoidia bacterium]